MEEICNRIILLSALVLATIFFYGGCKNEDTDTPLSTLKAGFVNPPDSTRPGVYWYFMDGNMSEEGMTKDLESMKSAGIGKVVFLEVNIGVPRGKVDFLSEEWLQRFKHAEQEARRLGIEITLGIGPGWTGSGGPWVPANESMQHLVSSSIQVTGGDHKTIKLPLPQPKAPYFGEGIFTPELRKEWEEFYSNVAMVAFPTPAIQQKIKDTDEKALYYRAPFTSVTGVKPFLPTQINYTDTLAADIPKDQVIDLTNKLLSDGTLDWTVPEGNWTIMRFVSRNNGAITRPAPAAGLGFECDKMDTIALGNHLSAYVGKIFQIIGKPDSGTLGGLKMLHMDSWEMGAQNWTPQFRREFLKRRGYDPLPFYPVYAGYIVGTREMSERFLWDLRQTCQELVLENHAAQVKRYAHRHGLGLSIEPYDMNPTADLELGKIADVPMGEFWSKGYGFNSSFSCIEAASIAHVNGDPVVQAEAFTAGGNEAWKQYPGSMKDQGDWAFAAGINGFFYHTFEHKPWDDTLRPGMTMGPYGVHWDRKQTWWPMAVGYHRYISRCQFMLQKGRTVADILYLTPEGAPQVFIPPSSAMTDDPVLPDRRGYNFDGCAPGQLYAATIKDQRIVFPGGASYRLLVLPAVETMTPRLLEKIKSLVQAGAVIVGLPPKKSPSLSGFPGCDSTIQVTAKMLWGSLASSKAASEHIYGKGKVIWAGNPGDAKSKALYPEYSETASILYKMGVPEDFESSGPVRYTHRTAEGRDIYFVSNRTDQQQTVNCTFRTTKGEPELWDPLTGKTRMLPEFSVNSGRTTIPMEFQPYQSFFVVFAKDAFADTIGKRNFPNDKIVESLGGPWSVSFDPQWGGPEKVQFDTLVDWTSRPEDGIKYYSGIAVYHQSFDLKNLPDTSQSKRLFMDLGKVKNMARVTLNGHDLGVVWTEPWQVDISGIVKQGDNQLEITVANLWPNRLIGDAPLPDDGIKDGKFPDWLTKGEKRTSGRYTFTTYNPYHKDDPLLPSGLIGPVNIIQKLF